MYENDSVLVFKAVLKVIMCVCFWSRYFNSMTLVIFYKFEDVDYLEEVSVVLNSTLYRLFKRTEKNSYTL